MSGWVGEALRLVVTETTRQFEIAFKMIDSDGNDFVDLKEFSKVCRTLAEAEVTSSV